MMAHKPVHRLGWAVAGDNVRDCRNGIRTIVCCSSSRSSANLCSSLLHAVCLAALLSALPLLAACVPERATYSFGLSTAEIVGLVDVEDPATSGPPLVLVYQYHYKFIDFGQGADPAHPGSDLTHPGEEITYPTASLAYVRTDGAFSITVPVDVVAVEAFFIAPDRLTDLFQFKKQVGIGRIVYRPKLPRVPNWRNHFYTYLVPELEHVIVDARYELPVQDQQTLSTWITNQRKRLEDQRAQSQAKPADSEEPEHVIENPQ